MPARSLTSLTLAVIALVGCAGRGQDTMHHAAGAALGPYSGSVATGELVFLSGKIGRGGDTFEAEADTALAAVEAELRRNGLTFRDLVQVTVYLTDMDQYAAFNEVYAARIPPPYPARACVAVSALPGGARVEIQAVARRGSRLP